MHMCLHLHLLCKLHVAPQMSLRAPTAGCTTQVTHIHHNFPLFALHHYILHFCCASWVCVCVCVCDWHLDNIYLSHFNVLSIQSGTPAMAAKPLCGEKRFQGVHPHYWSHVSEVQKGRSDGVEVSRGMSTTALQGLSFSPNTRWCRIYQLFLTGMFIQENWNCLGGKREPQVHHGPFL